MGWNWDAGSGVGETEFIDLSNPTNDCTTTDFPLPAFGGAGDLVWLMVPGMMKMELLIITINSLLTEPSAPTANLRRAARFARLHPPPLAPLAPPVQTSEKKN